MCPIIDQETLKVPDIGGSLLVQQTLALVGSLIQPSLLHDEEPSSHYANAKALLHREDDRNPLAALLAVMLFYWWSTCAPHVAQELGFHRELPVGQALRPGETAGLRRRIWWSLYARERIISICQGRPCIINPRDCNVRKPSRDDFPDANDLRAEIFVQWVQLCTTVGRVADHLRCGPSTDNVVADLLEELREWAHGLPAHLRLPFFDTTLTQQYERDICLLHLPYLSTIILLNMKRSGVNIPTANTVAMLSACCVARIFEEFLVSGSLRFLQGMAGWHIAIATLALLHARQVRGRKETADAHIHVLRVALGEISQRWESAKMYDKGVQRLLAVQDRTLAEIQASCPQDHLMRQPDQDLISNNITLAEEQDGLKYFPGATKEISPLFGILLSKNELGSAFPHENTDNLGTPFYDLFDNSFDNSNFSLLEHLTSWGPSGYDPFFT
ncbi:hypothetical protein VF21_05156 [Pseudogymnoascus sp. 05NY08]|nr:hypothetical protein VF21_05156 [Pseudogymnoascus sp. 05NY08]